MKPSSQSAVFLLSAFAVLAISTGCGSAMSPANAGQQASVSGAGNSGPNSGSTSSSGGNGSSSSGSSSTSSTTGSTSDSGSDSSTSSSSSSSSGSGSSSTTGASPSSGSTVTTTPSPVPSSAIAVSSLQTMPNWQAAYDMGTSGSSGTSTGAMSLVPSPSLSGQAREFATTYTDSGGERYSLAFGSDTESTNFFYDVWIYLPDPPVDIANLEFDTDQVLSNGQTVIFGFQCDGYSRTWDYAQNAGAPAAPVDSWVHSSASCNVQNWTPETWHHVQVSYSRDNSGNVTYNSVWFDDVEQPIAATVPSAFALGWASTLLTNFQVDGLGPSGSSTVLLDNLTIYRW